VGGGLGARLHLELAIDGHVVATQDLYAPGYGDTTFTFGLSDGIHTIVVSATGMKNAASRDVIVTLEFTAL
jgi:hypothetical protein